jgi:ATP-dependent DNA helicase DinG
MTSATLTTNGTFEYIKSEVGLSFPTQQERTNELVVESPFNYQDQMALVIPNMPPPTDKRYLERLPYVVERCIRNARGRTLVLFTSYKNLYRVKDHLHARKTPYQILSQGDAPRTQLIKSFKEDVSSVLLGTESFWSGVDVPGEALSCLIIDKLPFPSPGDPVLDAIAEMDPYSFWNHSVPRAVIAFKQGVGRLIRTVHDSGVVVVLDSRILTKSYGDVFIDAVPECAGTEDIEDISVALGD